MCGAQVPLEFAFDGVEFGGAETVGRQVERGRRGDAQTRRPSAQASA